MELFIHA
jgi:hypothetical protein